MTDARSWPRALVPWRGRLDARLCEGAVAGMGDRGDPARALLEAGLVPPDVLMGLTLHLLAQQPRRNDAAAGRDARDASGATPIECGVWVREQMTIHAPVAADEELALSGQALGQFTRRGRRYGVTRCEARGADGLLRVTNTTTGLLSYRRDPTLGDAVEGVTTHEAPEPSAPADLPARSRLHAVRVGDVVEAAPATLTLDAMRLRDAGRNDNRIHTDPEIARRAGLAAPIAAGSHVVAFAFAALMAEWGPECLLHGARVDVRWVGQTRAGDTIRPRITVTEARPERIVAEVVVAGADRALVTGALQIPRAARA